MDKGWIKRTIAMGIFFGFTITNMVLFAVGLFKVGDYKNLERQRDNTIKNEVMLTDEYKTTYNSLVSKYAQEVVDGKISGQEFDKKIDNLSEEAYLQTVNNTQADERVISESEKVKKAEAELNEFDVNKYSNLGLGGALGMGVGLIGATATEKVYERSKKKKNKGLYLFGGKKTKNKTEADEADVEVKVVSPEQLGIQDYPRAWDP